MGDMIQRYVIPPLTKAQEFIVNLLCDYYEQRSDKHCKLIDKLTCENECLLEEKKSLQSQVSSLQHKNSDLSYKLRQTNNMIRLLTKTKEETMSCKTPVKINVSDVDCLLKKKLNKTMDDASKKTVHNKTLPARVVQKKDVKKVVLPKGKESNAPCVKNTLKKDTNTQKRVPTVMLKKYTTNLPNNRSPSKTIILLNGESNRKSTLRVVSKPKKSEKVEQKTKLETIMESKTTDLKIQQNLNTTFVING